jgi:signal transduction histidine kinase
MAHGLAEAEGVRLDRVVAPGVPAMRADRLRAAQVLQNLLANAVQHSARGGAVALHVAPVTTGERPMVEFQVLDRGPGFAAGEESRIFEPFYSRRRGGTGMGLALAHRLVHDHGGEITAANRVGGGACLRVTFPSA